MRILITGSRDWTDRETLNAVLDEYADIPFLVVVHGDCPTGADRMAKEWCEANDKEQEAHPADWHLYYKGAGPRRNTEMVKLGAELCIAFPLPQSRGTFDCLGKARRAGIPVRVVEPGSGGRARPAGAP